MSEVLVETREELPREHPVSIFFNDQELVTIQASPTHLDELAVGFLVGEGFLLPGDKITRLGSNDDHGLVWVESDTPKNGKDPRRPDPSSARRYLTSGCGRGVTFATWDDARRATPVNSSFSITPQAIVDLMRDFLASTPTYKKSGGVHASALCTPEQVLFVREDVGRHNTIDKLIGRAYLDGLDVSDHLLLSTGRISYEMALKAARLGVSVVASLTAATDLAVRVAKELNLEVVGYVRGGKVVSFASAGRLIQGVIV